MKFPRTRTAWKRLVWAWNATVRWNSGNVLTPLAYLNPGEKARKASKDLWQGHALVNVGTEFGRELFSVRRKEAIWAIWFFVIAVLVGFFYG
jgi:hypothetical protein